MRKPPGSAVSTPGASTSLPQSRPPQQEWPKTGSNLLRVPLMRLSVGRQGQERQQIGNGGKAGLHDLCSSAS